MPLTLANPTYPTLPHKLHLALFQARPLHQLPLFDLRVRQLYPKPHNSPNSTWSRSYPLRIRWRRHRPCNPPTAQSLEFHDDIEETCQIGGNRVWVEGGEAGSGAGDVD